LGDTAPRIMNGQKSDDATDGSDLQDPFAALNQVLLDEERRKRREKKDRKKKKKKHQRHSPSSHSNGSEDINPQDKSAAVEAVSRVELQETAPDPLDGSKYGFKLDEAATDPTALLQDGNQGIRQQKKLTTNQDYDDEKNAFLRPEVAAPDSTAWSQNMNQHGLKNVSFRQSDVENTIAASPNPSDEKSSFLRSKISSESSESDGTIAIPYDSFSMFYAASSYHDHIVPATVFIVQIIILVLIAINLFEDNDKPTSNRMNVPVDVSTTVTMAQYIACFVSVFTADDLITGTLYVGKQIINDENLPPSHWKWKLSNIMRMSEGALVIFVSFTFIVQSDTAIDLFLNFAGVTFVGTLDDVFFILAKNGFLGERNNRLARRVSKMRAYHDESRGHAHKVGKMEFGRYVLFAVLIITMWIGLSFIVSEQDKLKFACKSVSVEVSDPKYTWIRNYAGIYDRERKRKNQRAVYEKREKYYFARIVYWNSNKRWVIHDDSTDGDNSTDGSMFSLVSV
jgi:hypothetical protein